MALILVADDDPAVRRVSRTALERAGHRVLEAADGDVCLELAREHQPAVVVLDIFMPGRDGIETVQALKETLPGIRVLVISGGGTHGVSEGALADARLLGADRTLAKPFSVQDLQDSVAALADGA